jgi:hypothetical protein
VFVDFGQIDRRGRARRLGVDRADHDFRRRLALDPQGRGVQPERKILRHQRGVARREIDIDDARDAGAVGIDRHRINGRRRIQFRRPRLGRGKRRDKNQAGRDQAVCNHSHDISPQISARRSRQFGSARALGKSRPFSVRRGGE